MTATKVAKTSFKYVNWCSFKIHRSSFVALNLSSVGEFFWSSILTRALGRFPFFRTGRPDHFRHNENFTFILNIIHEGDGFSEKKKSWRKPISVAN